MLPCHIVRSLSKIDFFSALGVAICNVLLRIVRSRKRMQRYALLWNWQASSMFFFKKTAFFLLFRFIRTADFFLRYFFMSFFGTSLQEMRHVSKCPFLYRTHVRTKKKPIKTDKNRWKHLFFCPTLTLPKGRNTIRNTGILTTQQYFLDTNYHQLFTNL